VSFVKSGEGSYELAWGALEIVYTDKGVASKEIATAQFLNPSRVLSYFSVFHDVAF
jgi:hypothetical protein